MEWKGLEEKHTKKVCVCQNQKFNYHILPYLWDNSKALGTLRSNCWCCVLHWSAETVAESNCGKKAWVAESGQLVALSQLCCSTLFGQNPDVFSIPSNDYPWAPCLFTWLGSEWFFLVPEDQRGAQGSSFCRQRSHEEGLWGCAETCSRRSIPGVF